MTQYLENSMGALSKETIEILFLENNPATGKYISNLLTRPILGRRVEIEMVDSAAYGLQQLTEKRFDILLIDLALQDGNAFENLVLLKALAPEIPVILLADAADDSLARRLVKEGAHECLPKIGLSGELLSRTITYVLERMEMLTKLQRARYIEQYLAYYDALTGLPNRKLFLDRLDQALSNARRNEEHLAVMLLDLDGFQQINNTIGHSAGDRVLKVTTQRLEDCIRKSDTIARIGGDEFAIILSALTSELDAGGIARKVLQQLARPVELAGNDCYITSSCGIALFPEDGDGSEALLKNANIALHRTKTQDKNNFHFYNTKLDAITFERMSLKASLRRAMNQGEFVLFYLPIVEGAGFQITGFEALVYWDHPEKGLIPPMKFLPLAEEIGLAVPLGEWVIRTACKQNMALQRAGLLPLPVSVNISGKMFRHKNLPMIIIQALEECGMLAEYLVLEITENQMSANADFTARWIKSFKNMGIKIAIDDFGTGLSSMNLLKQIPVDMLKIDSSFIQEIPGSQQDLAIVSAIIALARKLNLGVVAEGIEKIEQARYLQSLGCDELQGFYFSRPIKFDILTRHLAGPAPVLPLAEFVAGRELVKQASLTEIAPKSGNQNE